MSGTMISIETVEKLMAVERQKLADTEARYEAEIKKLIEKNMELKKMQRQEIAEAVEVAIKAERRRVVFEQESAITEAVAVAIAKKQEKPAIVKAVVGERKREVSFEDEFSPSYLKEKEKRVAEINALERQIRALNPSRADKIIGAKYVR